MRCHPSEMKARDQTSLGKPHRIALRAVAIVPFMSRRGTSDPTYLPLQP
jgi:hypothetical protein